MKIAFVFGPFCLGGAPDGSGASGFNFGDMWGDPRGLTGSEVSFFRIAQEMVKRGHEVYAYTFSKGPMPSSWEGLLLRPFSSMGEIDSSFDLVYSWNEVEPLRNVRPGPLRAVNLQINDFVHCRPGFHEFVDLWTSPSESHRQMILSKAHPVALRHGEPPYSYCPDPSKWVVLTNGCDPDAYSSYGVGKVPGRVIWASSPDRGLHWLLQEWPKIRRACPAAHLRIFYKVNKWLQHFVDHDMSPGQHPTIYEQIRRATYIREALRRLSGHGIELMDCVSRIDMGREMAQAECLAYSCDTFSWTEGFSVSLMEACAAGAAPVTLGSDALPEIYGSHIPVIPRPAAEHIGEFSDEVIRVLTDPVRRADINSRAAELARSYSWASIAERLENHVIGRRRSSSSAVSRPAALQTDILLFDEKFEPRSYLTDRRGLSGSVINAIGMAEQLARSGHSVRLFARVGHQCSHSSVFYADQDKWDRSSEADVVIAYNDFRPLSQVRGPLTVGVHQCLEPLWKEHVDPSTIDVNVSPSEWSMAYTRANYFPGRDWEFVLNGADAGMFPPRSPVPGRITYHTSASRGLHLLLRAMPEIRRRVPNAHLQIIGDYRPWVEHYRGKSFLQPDLAEHVRRVEELSSSLETLGKQGYVTSLFGMSRNEVLQELSWSSCFAFPCSLVIPCETFSVSVMESCRMGVPVVLVPADALGSIYGGAVEIVSGPAEGRLGEFTDSVVRVLTDQTHAAAVSERERAFASAFTMEAAGLKMDSIIRSRLKSRKI